MGLNLILGYTGLVSMGHAAFFGTAVYVVAFLTVRLGLGVLGWLRFWASWRRSCGRSLRSFIVHLSGAYFLLITLGLSQLLFSIVWQWRALTGGDDGLPGIPRPDLGLSLSMGDDTYFYYFIFLIFVGSFCLLFRLTRLPFRPCSLIGIRENEFGRRSSGIIPGGISMFPSSWRSLWRDSRCIVCLHYRVVYPGDIGRMASVMVLLRSFWAVPGRSRARSLGRRC